MKVRDYRSGVIPLTPGRGFLGHTMLFTIQPGSPQRVLPPDPARRRATFEVRSPVGSNAFFASNQSVRAATGNGIRIAQGGSLIDEHFYPHGGEWWIDVDTANTIVAVTPVY